MRVDYTTEAKLGDNADKCLINIEIDDDMVADIQVFDPDTGKDLTGLIYGGPTWDQAWSIAERRILMLPMVQQAIHRTFREQTYDTPYRG